MVFPSEAGLEIDDCRVLFSADSSFANVDDGAGETVKSQAGCALGIRAKEGDRLHFVELSTGMVKRVCRSTFVAEANGLVAPVEAADYLRSVIFAITRTLFSLSEPMSSELSVSVQVYTDAKSVFGVVDKDTSRPRDKRLRVVVAQLREMFSVPGTVLTWIDNIMMLADCSTIGAERGCLLGAVAANLRSDNITEEAMAVKRKVREGRHSRAEAARHAKLQEKNEDGMQLVE